MRIAICHQTFAAGDAIGRDIVGMCETLESCGHEPVVFCECDVHRGNHWKVTHDFSEAALSGADLLIYHHSQDWPLGLEVLGRTTAPVVFKFHNITPPRFFSGYSSVYEERCHNGETLTRVLTQLQRPHLWLCDSEFNRTVLVDAGVDPTRAWVAPPFNNTDALLHHANTAEVGARRLRFLFVGRFAPNKAHRHSVRLAEAYRRLFGDDFELIITGSIDPHLRSYWNEFTRLVRDLDLTTHVRVLPHISDAAAHALFQSAHVYLTFSEHEGFCVPVIEAQAVGLPVVGSGATAVRETAGAGQFLGSPPARKSDYEFYAELAHLAARDPQVRLGLATNGRRNVLARFTRGATEAAFLEPLLPWLLSSA